MNSLVPSGNDNGGGSGQTILPDFYFSQVSPVRKGGIPLPETSSVVPEIIEMAWFIEKHQSINKRSTNFRRSDDQPGIAGRQRKNGNFSKIVRQRNRYAVNLEAAGNRCRNFDDLFEVDNPVAISDPYFDPKSGFSVTNDFSGRRSSKGTNISGNGNRFEKISLPLTVGADDNIQSRINLDGTVFEIPKIPRLESDEFHRHRPKFTAVYCRIGINT